MPRRRWISVGWVFGLALAADPRPCRAGTDDVAIDCPPLGVEDAAEVEARVRATLLLAPPPAAEIHIRCQPALATVVASRAGRDATVTLSLPAASFKDALLLAAERALAAVQREASSSVSFPSAAPVEPAAAPAPTPAPTPQPTPPPAATASPHAAKPAAAKSAPARPTYRISAGLMLERWTDLFAYGWRAALELGGSAWSGGVAGGGLFGPEQAGAFVPGEWHVLGFGAYEARSLAGLRGSIGIGLSALVVTPEPGLIAHGATTRHGLFVDAALSRALRKGRFAVVPELHLRVFSARRDVEVDGRSTLELPRVCPAALLSLRYEL
jgi:hypothetical protein